MRRVSQKVKKSDYCPPLVAEISSPFARFAYFWKLADLDELDVCENFTNEINLLRYWNQEANRGGNDDLLRDSLRKGHLSYNRLNRVLKTR